MIGEIGEFLRVAHVSRVLVSASRRNNLFFEFRPQWENGIHKKSSRSPARETRALPRI